MTGAKRAGALRVLEAVAACVIAMLAFAPALASEEPPDLLERVQSGDLPPLAQRLPNQPRVINLAAMDRSPGRYGGVIDTLMAEAKDIRMMTVYGYARLIGFNKRFELVPDILERVDVEDGRIFTLVLREGHRWSDGHPFTSEDFRYWWEDVATDPELSRAGPPQVMSVEGELPRFDVIDSRSVRYSWSRPNAEFLPSLAGARANYIYQPAHYMRRFHRKYADPEALAAIVEAEGRRDWIAVHRIKSRQYRPENPSLPSLQPWVNTVAPPAEQFVFKRNPYYHRVDENGRQLPYIGEVRMRISTADIIPAKTGAGETDLQARYLRFDDYTFLKRAEKSHPLKVLLWKEGTGSRFALLPNLNTEDATWRAVMRDVRFRRAVSLAIDRHEINQQFFFGLGTRSANTVLPDSPLFSPALASAFAFRDVDRANALLDEMGLERGPKGIRLLPDGREAHLVVEYSGGDQESDILGLVAEYMGEIGIKFYQRAMKRDNLRRRFLAGKTLMSVWTGLTLGLATPALSPEELAPVSAAQGNWPKWGEHFQSGGKAGEPPDDPHAVHLLELYLDWKQSQNAQERTTIWQEMLAIHAEQIYVIGTVTETLQPVVVHSALRNVPEKGVFSFMPTAYFGVYLPDTFWFDEAPERAE